MDSTIARVGSVALTELKAELTNLSNTLHQIYDLMQADLRQVNVAWQDGKYQEFVDNYQPQIQKCDEIANRYTEWCVKVLDPTIENVIAVETTDVGNGDGSVGEWSSTAAVGAGVAAAGVVGAAGGFDMFNLGANQGPRSTTKVRASGVPTPSKRDYYDAFKKHGIYVVDENGHVKLDRNKLIDAVNEVTGNNPVIKVDERMKENQLGRRPHGMEKIFLNKKLTDGQFIETYAHESQHIDQEEHCNINKGKNSRDAICENLKMVNYKEPCVDAEEEMLGPKRCKERFDEYWNQIAEVNARRAGTNAREAAEDYLYDMKFEYESQRKYKFEKPRAYKIK